MNAITKASLIFCLTALLTACANGPLVRATKFTQYEDFKPGPEGGVDLVWARAGLRSHERLRNKIAQYDSVIITPVIVVLDENSDIDDQDVKEISQYLVSHLQQHISRHKAIVGQPTGKSLRLYIAISNVETPNPVLAVTSSVLPVGLGISAIAKVTTGEHTNVGSATIELMVSDAQTGKPLFAAIDRQAGNKDFSTMIDSLDDAKDAIHWWVQRLGVTLNTHSKRS
ncbi:hypothetical protein VST7929_03160 [Vibrio stylophorae]|uniref:DUF3313 domain-containing protein n=1 Tax=Vibrio stylophorae TaxID=659351 RepID=A0ABM8ZXU7_9VIBR|nr:DUF3313 domain-containing protein [Vibrio stylophorae]CAH0535650.1 hypothetical protein VST7929_03160 [Vibrio stylophorae]